jgi:NADH-quinone oxidoreductase subunit C
MDSDALVPQLHELLPQVRVESAPSRDAHATIYIERDDVLTVMKALKLAPTLGYTLLAELTAADYWPREPRFEVVFILISIERGQRVRVKVRLGGEDAHMASVSGLWPAANWLEREVWDLFGIAFDDHPDPRRLLMPEDWEGYPLRKDYPVQVQMAANIAEPMQLTAEEFRRNLEKDRLSRQ